MRRSPLNMSGRRREVGRAHDVDAGSAAAWKRLVRNSRAVQRSLVKLGRQLGRPPGAHELAQAAGLAVEEVYESFELEWNRRMIFGQKAVKPRTGDKVAGRSGPHGRQELNVLLGGASFSAAMEPLAMGERLYLELALTRGLAQGQIAERLGLSRAQVSGLHRRVVAGLRRAMAREGTIR